jgi:hypothetical protein
MMQHTNSSANKSDSVRLLRQINYLLLILISGLVISGLTAFPIQTQLAIAHQCIETYNIENALTNWIEFVYKGIADTNTKYPFVAYGTDWLAFAHLVIAVAFIGPLKDPVKNIWVIHFGIIACTGIFPLAFIAGAVREIPFHWQLIDCSFGIVGGAILLLLNKKIKKLEHLQSTTFTASAKNLV